MEDVKAIFGEAELLVQRARLILDELDKLTQRLTDLGVEVSILDPTHRVVSPIEFTAKFTKEF